MVPSSPAGREKGKAMFINSWAIALLVSSAAALFALGGATRTAVKVLRHWDPGSDSASQIALENETCLAALFIRFALLLQLFSLLLLVLAADSFSHILAGAMCATGAFVANDYGMPALAVKLFGVFFYGFWLVVHRLDLQSEFQPLTRLKFGYLLLLGPLLVADISLVGLYLAGLRPDIITSCCGVVFAAAAGEGRNLVGPLPTPIVMLLFYGLAGLLFVLAFILKHGTEVDGPAGDLPLLGITFAGACLGFFMLALVVITAVISPYIYALPSHRCPFDILRKEYYAVGYPIYISLMALTFAGISGGITIFVRKRRGLVEPVRRFRKTCLRLFLLLLPVFLLLVSWYPARYLLTGGE